MKIMVIGIGQKLRGDDAAGLEAVLRWRAKYPTTANNPAVQVEISELPGLGLLDLMQGADGAVLIDAVHSSRPPGSLLHLGLEDLSAFDSNAGSAHGWGVAETLRLGQSLSPALENCRITLIGIEAGQFELGQGLSSEVESALDEAVELIEKELDVHLRISGGSK